MLTEERHDGDHVSGHRAIDTEKIGDREVAPFIAVPPGQQEIRGARGLPGIRSSLTHKSTIQPKIARILTRILTRTTKKLIIIV